MNWNATGARPIAPWRMPAKSMAWRLFLTCWIIYGLHFSTDVVREHYPAVALGDHLSFRLDEYGGLHPDLFETPGRGWHIGNNPGISMLAAIPYVIARPLIDRIVDRVRTDRRERGDTVPPAFDSPRFTSPIFYDEAYRRGLDIKLGLAAFVTQAFFMAPASALAVVLVFFVLRALVRDDRSALWLSVLYAFGTPVFYRTGFLNHNLMLGHIAFAGMVAVWNPHGGSRLSAGTRAVLAGVAGGTAVLFDYSGAVLLLGLFAYVLGRRFADEGARAAFLDGVRYVAGSVPPVLLLWFYQWRAFGNPFLPGQNWMPPVQWSDLGYQGYGTPQPELFLALGFDLRFGLFITAPVLMLAVASLLPDRRRALRGLELATCLLIPLAVWVFFSGNNYTRLQWNTGIRYMAPVLPFLFIPAALALLRLPRTAALLIGLGSIVLNWCMAMSRIPWRPLGVFHSVIDVFTAGFQLPALTTLSQMEAFRAWVPEHVSPLPLFALVAALIGIVWMRRPGIEPGRSPTAAAALRDASGAGSAQ